MEQNDRDLCEAEEIFSHLGCFTKLLLALGGLTLTDLLWKFLTGDGE